MSDITKDQVVEWLSSQSVIEVAELVKELEEKWGVSAAAPAAAVHAARGVARAGQRPPRAPWRDECRAGRRLAVLRADCGNVLGAAQRPCAH